MDKKYQKALDLFEKKDYNSAFILFDELKKFYEAGYCKFVTGKIADAENIWLNSKIDSPAIRWGYCIISLINLTIPNQLTFFQIRNFLERDLDILLENKQIKYVENIISAAEILSEYNPETHKFIGRVLLNHGYFNHAAEFLFKARDICYTDPEVQYLLAQYYFFIQDKTTAVKILQNAIKTTPTYFPIKHLLESAT